MPIPRDGSPDSTLALLSKGYLFISDRCERLDTDAFETRLMLRRAVCMRGEEAARQFYVPGRFTRRGALPLSTLLLQDKGSVATLDGEAHRRRKQMFMSLMTPESLLALVAHAEAGWRERFVKWEGVRQVTLLQESREVMCRAACRWTGVPLAETELPERTRELVAMIEGAGSAGPRNWRGQLLRARTERWVRTIVERVRKGAFDAPPGSGLAVIASHRDAEGRLLDTEVAVVEIINLLRPTVAVARFIAFAALALHRHPEWRDRLATGDDEPGLEMFVQEVRRFYPFFPVVAGRALEEFEWRDHRFRKGDWVVLDLYGTDHDARTWQDPEAFRPERFRETAINPFDLIPQGGGDFIVNHRCPGEWATIALMKSAVALLTRAIRYDVPAQDLDIDLSRMPTAPRSGFVMRDVRRIA